MVAVVVAATSCGGDGFDYTGKSGQAVPVTLTANVPIVTVSVDGAGAYSFVCDTGSPVTAFDSTIFDKTGVVAEDLGAFGLGFPGHSVIGANLFAAGEQPSDGLIGWDILGHFAFTIDYQGSRAWLADPWSQANVPAGVSTMDPMNLPFELLGGGVVEFPDCNCSVRIGPTRIAVQAVFEGHVNQPVWVMVDTGASDIVLDETFLASLGDTPARPHLDLDVSTPDGDVSAYYTRVWAAKVQGTSGDDFVSLDNLPVLVEPGTDIFTATSAEVGRPIVGLIGGGYLRYFLSTIDYQARELRLAQYTDESHIDPDEFVGVGFDLVLAADGTDWAVDMIYAGTDAETQGMQIGDIVDELGATAITGQSADVVNNALDAYQLGDRVPVTLRRSPAVTLDILVENLLPDYPPPT